MKKSILPPLTQEAIHHVDGTPNEEYPLRILRAYRENCNYRWEDNTEGKPATNHLVIEMNKLCDERAAILDKAIQLLEKGGK